MIEVKELSKHFGKKKAVDGVSFCVGRGEVLGFLGPNAAGKSTTMRMITGFLPPTSGTAVIGGADIILASLAARHQIGYLPENAPAYPDMSVVGFLDFIAQIRGVRGGERRRRIEETVERCFLQEVRYQTISTLSKGFKQRVCFAQSILHDPEYLIMDEPTDGLDPNQKHEVRSMIREMAAQKTIILSTHILEEVEAVCTRVIIIADGRLILDDTPERLKTRSTVHGAVCFSLRRPEGEGVVSDLTTVPGVQRVEFLKQTRGQITVRAYPDPKAPKSDLAQIIIRHLGQKGLSAETLFVEEGRLDEVFRMVTMGAEREAGG
jgi:ABC-2 type transport system ATP-binding protein